MEKDMLIRYEELVRENENLRIKNKNLNARVEGLCGEIGVLKVKINNFTCPCKGLRGCVKAHGSAIIFTTSLYADASWFTTK